MQPVLNDKPDDTALLARIRSGSTEALGELFTRHAEAVYRLAYRLSASVEDAEDVLQDVFVGLPRALERYQEQGQFLPWLKRVTARTALMKRRSRERRREDAIEEVSSLPAPTSAHALDRLETRRALKRVPESLRTVFMLKEVEGYSHGEIAELLGITPGASAARLSRAWTLLRKEVGHS